MAANENARTVNVGTSSTFVDFPLEADYQKVAPYDAAGVAILWVQLDNAAGAASVGGNGCERILPGDSALIPWGYIQDATTGQRRPGRYMIAENATSSVNIVTAKGRV